MKVTIDNEGTLTIYKNVVRVFRGLYAIELVLRDNNIINIKINKRNVWLWVEEEK